MINWGKRSDGNAFVISTSVIADSYIQIATWRKNVFLVPHGEVGRDFIDQVTLHINDWNSGSDNQHISLKAAFVLQKPSPKSKAKDPQDVLPKRLIHWRQSEINELLRKCRIIQGRIAKLKASEAPDRSKAFPKLLLEGQINLALRFLSLKASGGVLALTDQVMSQLKQKHPNPQSAKLVSLLFGPINDHYLESVYTEINSEMVRQAALRAKGVGGPSGVDANGFRKIPLASPLNSR